MFYFIFFFSGHDRSNVENGESKLTSIELPQLSPS